MSVLTAAHAILWEVAAWEIAHFGSATWEIVTLEASLGKYLRPNY